MCSIHLKKYSIKAIREVIQCCTPYTFVFKKLLIPSVSQVKLRRILSSVYPLTITYILWFLFTTTALYTASSMYTFKRDQTGNWRRLNNIYLFIFISFFFSQPIVSIIFVPFDSLSSFLLDLSF